MFKKIEELVESGAIQKEAAEALDAEIQTELSTLRAEAKGYRVERDELAKSFESAKQAKEQLEAKTADIDKQIESAKEAGKAELVTVLQAERAKNEELVGTVSQMEKVNTELRVSNAIASELGKYQVKKEAFADVQELLRLKAVADNETVKIGDKPIDEGIKHFFESRKTYLEPVGGAGSGSGGTGGSGSVPNKGDLGGDMEARTAAIQAKLDAAK
jgi:chromosome segregation ATPase